MSISKDLDMRIKDGVASLSENFYIYQDDGGIELRLKVNYAKLGFKSSKRTLSFSNTSIFVGTTILKPNSEVIVREKVEVFDDIIRFQIDKSLADDLDEIGVYKIQFHLYDWEDNRITLPPVSFEVKELIGRVNTGESAEAVVGKSKVDLCQVAKDTGEINIFSNGRYVRTEWFSGDLITAGKLNKIEFIIENLDNRLNEITTDGNYVNINKIPYSSPAYANISTVKDALDKLLYFDLTISLSSDKGTTVEKGTTLSNVGFRWTYNKSVVSQAFNGVNLDSSIRNYTFTGSFNSNKTFTLSANDGEKNFSKSISFNFLNGRYWGVSQATDYDSAFILSLSKELSSSRAKTFTVNCGEGQHIFYCIPTSFGTPTFTVGGFSGGFNKVNTLQFTNSSGFTESYDVWKSTNSNLGNTTVVVS